MMIPLCPDITHLTVHVTPRPVQFRGVVESVAGQFSWLNVSWVTPGHHSYQCAPPLGDQEKQR